MSQRGCVIVSGVMAGGSVLTVSNIGRMGFAETLAVQERLLQQRIADEIGDHLLLVEHEPVYTLGRGADEAELLGAPERLDVPVFRIGRGGGVTFHGPGQMVGYPIVALRHAGRDVHRYVRALEDVLIDTCKHFGIAAQRREGFTGVWVGNEKLAAIGIGVRRWVAFHGVALNVSTDLRYFECIVPCRVPALPITSLERLLGAAPEISDVAAVFTQCFAARMGYAAIQFAEAA